MLFTFMEIRIKVKKFDCNKLKIGEYYEYKGSVYKFLGYDYGTYPIGENIDTKEIVTLPHY